MKMPKFNLSQKVWIITDVPVKRLPEGHPMKISTVCSGCEGKTSITLKDGSVFVCPKCKGEGKFYEDMYVYFPVIFFIDNIVISNDGSIRYKKTYSDISSVPEDELYVTKEEAQLKCDEINKRNLVRHEKWKKEEEKMNAKYRNPKERC
jgi:hypothetical protein